MPISADLGGHYFHPIGQNLDTSNPNMNNFINKLIICDKWLEGNIYPPPMCES